MRYPLARCSWIAAALAMTACGSINAFPDAAATTDPTIPDGGAAPAPRRSIIDHIVIPTASAEIVPVSLDLDGEGRPDNAFGQLTAVLGSIGNGSFAPTIAGSLQRGDLLLLAEYQGAAPGSHTGSFTLFAGANPLPAPCNPDETCGHHLGGNGVFAVAGDTPRTVPLTGDVATPFAAGPGPLVIELEMFGSQPFQLPLFGARVQLSDPAATHPTGILAGAVSPADRDAILLPAWAAGMREEVAASCSDQTAPPTCGCTPGSSGAKLIENFDTFADCVITLDEVAHSELLQTMLVADVTIDGAPGLSFGVGFSMVPAQFTP